MSKMTNIFEDKTWFGISELNTNRQKTILWAILAFVVYLTFVIIGTELQNNLTDKLAMNWGQQTLSLIAVLIFAFFHENPKELLGISSPKTKNWIFLTIIISIITIIFWIVISYITNTPEKLNSLEYYIYETFMPSLGEEIGLRGLFLGFLLYYLKQRNANTKLIWTVLIIHAIPFGLLHLLEVKNVTETILIFSYTTFAAIGLGWLRIKTNSIIPCILAHSLMNVCGNLIGYLILG